MQGEPPLHVTAVSGAIRCMEVLISRGADVKSRSKASLHTFFFISLNYNKTECYYYSTFVLLSSPEGTVFL
jgi:ankyrin repeat protein